MSVVATSSDRLSPDQLHDQLSAIIGEQPEALKLVKDKCYVHPNFEVDAEAQVQLWLSLVNEVFPRTQFKLNVKRKLFEFIYRFRYVALWSKERSIFVGLLLGLAIPGLDSHMLPQNGHLLVANDEIVVLCSLLQQGC
jgi:hypothetical protein